LTDHKASELDALIEAAKPPKQRRKRRRSWARSIAGFYNDYATLPIAEASIPFVADPKKVTKWDLGRTLYDNNDRDLIRR